MSADTFTYCGVRVTVSPFATTRDKQVEVVACQIRKRRRNWSVRVSWIEKPAAYHLANGSLICHPTIYTQLKKAAQR